MKVPRMSRVERRQLIRLGRRSDDPYSALRVLAVARLGRGCSNPRVAADLDFATSTVVGAADRFLADGVDGLYDRRSGNGERKADERFDQVLVRLLGRTPQDYGWQRPTWTRELLCLQMKLEGFPPVAVCTMGRAPSRVGARLGTPKPIVLCPWRRERKPRVLASIRRLEARARALGSRFFTPTRSTSTSTRRSVATGCCAATSAASSRRARIRSSTSPEPSTSERGVSTPPVPTVRTPDGVFRQLLWLLASRYRRARCIHLVLDNYGIHKATLKRKTLAAFGDRIVLHFLPPYCPDINLIERVWQDFHANVTRNHRCKTLNRLLDNARRYLDAYRWKRAVAKRPAARAA